MSGNTDHHQGVLLEEIRDNLQRFAEAMVDVPKDVRILKDDMREVKTRLTTVEIAVTDLSKQHCQLDKRVTRVERAIS